MNQLKCSSLSGLKLALLDMKCKRKQLITIGSYLECLLICVYIMRMPFLFRTMWGFINKRVRKRKKNDRKRVDEILPP